MELEWDEEKRRSNLTRHGLDFEDVHWVFRGEVLVAEDDRYDYTEKRFIGYGLLGERVVVVAFTLRGDEVIRVISMRKANKREQKAYHQK